MNFSIESEFVKKHIKKEYQERLLLELQSKKRREKALSRFAHSAQLILKDYFVATTIVSLEKNLFSKNCMSENCYVISDGANDGMTLPLTDALGFAKTSYMAVILITPKKIIIKEEYEGKEPLYFVAEA